MSDNPTKNYQNSIMGKKVPQIGGNSPNTPKPPSQVGGNNTNSISKGNKQSHTGGNYVQGQKVP